jgi:hypothetical protein
MNVRISKRVAFTLIVALAGCSGGGGGGGGSGGGGGGANNTSVAPGVTGVFTTGMPAPSREPAYQLTPYFEPLSLAGDTVTAMQPASSGGVVVAEGRNVYGTTQSGGFFEVRTFSDARQIVESNGVVYAATADPHTPNATGAGDLWARSNTGTWSMALNTQDRELVVADGGSGTWAAHGTNSTTVLWDDGLNGFAGVASIESAVPTSALVFNGELWLGVSDVRDGSAELFHGDRGNGTFGPVGLTAGRGGDRQEITAMISVAGVTSGNLLIAALGNYNSGYPISGEVVMTDGTDVETLARVQGGVPNAILWTDDTLYIGMSDGKLFYRQDDGSYAEEPGLGLSSIGALTLDNAGNLLIGGSDADGAVVLLRTAGAAAGLGYDAVAPLLASDCAVCHNGSMAAANGFLLSSPRDDAADYTTVSAAVDTANPAGSSLLAKASNSSSHVGGAIWAPGSSAYDTVLLWVQQGAPEVGAPGGGAGGPTFLDDIHPILRAGCSVLACHGGSASNFMINADIEGTYNRSVALVDTAVVENSALLRRPAADGVTHPGGPVAGYEKGTPNYTLIARWIGGGMQRGFTPGSVPGNKTFHDYVYPVIRVSCGAVACHGAPGGQGGLEINGNEAATYSDVVNRINQGTPTRSQFLRKPALDGTTHSGGLVPLHGVGDPNYDLILEWIDDGLLR